MTSRIIKARRALAAALLFGSVTFAAPASAETTLTLASYVPEHAASATSIKAWADEVTKRTNGELKFRFFWAGSLLPAADMAQGVRDGRADIGLVAQVYIPSRLPLSTVDSVPFMTSNVRAFGHAFVDMYAESEAMQAEYANNGLHMLFFAPADENLFYSKTELNGVADLKDKRIRAIGLGAPALQAVGASPVAISQDQVYESLNKGLLDATSGATMDLGVDFGFHTVAPNIIDPNYGIYASGSYSINKAKYDALDPAVTTVLDEMAGKFLDDYFFPDMQAAVAERCDKALAAGAKIIVWDSKETEAWKTAIGDTARQKWLETAAATGADAEAFLASYEAKVRENEKTMPWDGAGESCAAKAASR
ncbi:MAG TPA: TRAP transporter substrate-binding protein DctP [Rhizobiaceae bacterium]|nr:TRAP transporter substrate-binding protein DctP [Rhizobiaceae bacterium]